MIFTYYHSLAHVDKMVNYTLEDVMGRLEVMNETLKSVQSSVQVSNEKIDDTILPKLNKLEKELSVVKKQCNDLNERCIQMDSYNRRKNLIFGGIAESSPENVEEKLRHVITNILKVDCSNYHFETVRRLGKKETDKTRPIQAIFEFAANKRAVFCARKGLNHNSKIWITEDFPQEIQDRRRILKPILKHGYNIGYSERMFLTADKLIIADKTYTVDTLRELPDELKTEKVFTPLVGDKIMAFYNIQSPFSNFYPCKFQVDETPYNCVEQFFCSKKAEISGNIALKNQIMNESCPYKIKRMASSLGNSMDWKRQQEEIMRTGVNAKFRQNVDLKEFLLASKDRILVEAREDDKFWGAGMRHMNEQFLTKKWPGKNKLGNILVNIRKELGEN